jgi:hypothetical protein
MTPALRAELEAAGYTAAQIAKEATYLDRVAQENSVIGSDPAWNYGFHHVDDY